DVVRGGGAHGAGRVARGLRVAARRGDGRRPRGGARRRPLTARRRVVRGPRRGSHVTCGRARAGAPPTGVRERRPQRRRGGRPSGRDLFVQWHCLLRAERDIVARSRQVPQAPDGRGRYRFTQRGVTMKHHAWRLATGLTAAASALAVGVAAIPASASDDEYKVLVVGETLGFRHSHIDETTEAVIAIGEERGFTVDVWDSRQPELTLTSTPFTSAEDLAQYATIVFASPVDGTNNQDPARPRLLNDSELTALQGYIRDGGGYVGLHAATDTMHAVPRYSQLRRS